MIVTTIPTVYVVGMMNPEYLSDLLFEHFCFLDFCVETVTNLRLRTQNRTRFAHMSGRR